MATAFGAAAAAPERRLRLQRVGDGGAHTFSVAKLAGAAAGVDLGSAGRIVLHREPPSTARTSWKARQAAAARAMAGERGGRAGGSAAGASAVAAAAGAPPGEPAASGTGDGTAAPAASAPANRVRTRKLRVLNFKPTDAAQRHQNFLDRAPLLLEANREVLEGLPESGPAAAHYVALVPDLVNNTCIVMPVKRWYNFGPKRQPAQDASAEELDKRMREARSQRNSLSISMLSRFSGLQRHAIVGRGRSGASDSDSEEHGVVAPLFPCSLTRQDDDKNWDYDDVVDDDVTDNAGETEQTREHEVQDWETAGVKLTSIGKPAREAASDPGQDLSKLLKKERKQELNELRQAKDESKGPDDDDETPEDNEFDDEAPHASSGAGVGSGGSGASSSRAAAPGSGRGASKRGAKAVAGDAAAGRKTKRDADVLEPTAKRVKAEPLVAAAVAAAAAAAAAAAGGSAGASAHAPMAVDGQFDTLLTEREVRSFLARQNSTMKELAHKFAPRIKQNPQNKARLMQLLEQVAVMVEDPKNGTMYALKK